MKNIMYFMPLTYFLTVSAYAKANQECHYFNGVKVLNHQVWHGVKVPKEIINMKNVSDANVSTDSEAYESYGICATWNAMNFVNPMGNVSYYIKNSHTHLEYYVVNRWICINNEDCTKFSDYLYIIPSFSSQGFGELFSTSNYNSPSVLEIECYIQVLSDDGDVLSSHKAVNKLTIN